MVTLLLSNNGWFACSTPVIYRAHWFNYVPTILDMLFRLCDIMQNVAHFESNSKSYTGIRKENTNTGIGNENTNTGIGNETLILELEMKH